MSEFLGSRISLISKSDIRYVGILHEINSEDSTVSLENVRSFGTEGRKGKPDEEIPPSAQVYEYIVFRGSDVKDLRIEEAPAASNEKPPAVPDDPAILGARPRPANGPTPSSQRGPPGPGGFGQNPYPNNFYPPPIGHWGRGGGPVPGPGGFGAMPFPPPPGWSYPGQFPPGPGGPAPWNNNFGAFPPGPPGAPSAPGTSGTPGAAGQINRPGSNAPGPEQKPAPIGAGSDKKTGASGMQELPSEPKSLGQGPTQQQKPGPPSLPPGAGPSAEETKATSTTPGAASKDSAAQSGHIPTGPSAPTGPKATRTTAAAVAIPVIPRTTAGPSSTKPAGDASGGPPTATAIKDATQAAKAAVAMAMAKLDQGANQQNGTAAAMDNLTKKVNEMRVNAARGGVQSRGRGRGGRSAAAKVEVPDTDFDFASANAKFNKEDLVKEASSSGPVFDSTNGADAAQFQAPPTELPAYNKSRSFFDNISSESKERAENGGQKPGGREWRGEEQRRNIETFGQGSVDSGYRGYRGRSRGRGGARGRGYRGGRGGFHRPRDNSAIAQ